jgi:hypothetical protein
MSKIVYIYQGKAETVENMAELFQGLAKNNHFIKEANDGQLIMEDGSICEYFFTNIKKTKETLEQEVAVIRDEMRKSVALIQNQGLKLEASEMAKLKAQFEFLAEAKSKDGK